MPVPAYLSLKACAERLGVHYMTAYKYVRHGRLPAIKVGNEWRVAESDLEALLADAALPVPRGQVDWAGRLEDRLLAGDESGSWAVIESALASGLSPLDVHVDVLSSAMRRIGEGWRLGAVSIAEEHRATAVATKLVGRIGNRFSRRGRRRGRVVIGTPPGERHVLSVAVVADLLRGVGWDVVDVGCDLPVDAFIGAVEKSAPVSLVAISVSHRDNIDSARHLVTEVRSRASVPVVIGGAAVDVRSASAIAADGWASDGRAGIEAALAVTG